MRTPILGGAAALLLFLIWTLARRRPRVLLRSTDASAIAALNRAQIALLHRDPGRWGGAAASGAGSAAAMPGPPHPEDADAGIPHPGDARQRAQLKARLESQLRGDRQQRLHAMRIARHWGHPAALSVLRRGLRDVDPGVVLEAARGLDRFRRCPLAVTSPVSPQTPLPRNVSRTR